MTDRSLGAMLQLQPYQAYSYAYPHKSSYRALKPSLDLEALWSDEDKRALFLYLHIPFCSYRCGFCNLFALARPAAETVERYLHQIEQQLRVTAAALGPHQFARLAIGGGTPSYLQEEQLARLFAAVDRYASIELGRVGGGIEVSPETLSVEKLRICRDAGLERVSMGVQSFNDTEVRALIRPQQRSVVERSIGLIREQGFPILNLDLIYGIEGQSRHSFLASIESALSFAPEELYLYPLYVRPQTGLQRSRSGRRVRLFEILPEPVEDRLSLYQAGRELLISRGYEQVSMRMFTAPGRSGPATPDYRCQDDGMVGVGCGARSYTRRLHYSSEYGVSRSSVADILGDYLRRPSESFASVDHGFVLDLDERRRRYLIQSLLIRPGLSHAEYRARFHDSCYAHYPQLLELLDFELATDSDGVISLSPQGLARADTIGPWLASSKVNELMQDYEYA